MSKVNQFIAWSVGAVVIGVATLYGVVVYVTLDDDPLGLISCIDVAAPWRAWTCKQVLRHTSLEQKEIDELNSTAGAHHVLLMEDLHEAEETLISLLGQGVDINATHREAKGWTALHLAVHDPAERTALLLKHGARAEVLDEDGRTPLDLARHALTRFPDDPHLPATIQLLEQAVRR